MQFLHNNRRKTRFSKNDFIYFKCLIYCDHIDHMLNCNLTSSEGGNIRLVQMGVALQHLNHVISEVAPGAPLVFCGDFNSSPNSGNCTPVAMLQQPLPRGDKIPCPDRPLDGSEFCSFCCRQVCSSWSPRLRSLSSTQTGAARGRRSPAVWSCSLRSPRC